MLAKTLMQMNLYKGKKSSFPGITYYVLETRLSYYSKRALLVGGSLL